MTSLADSPPQPPRGGEAAPDPVSSELVPHPRAPLTELAGRLAGYISRAKSVNTSRAYASDWRDFSAWCSGHGYPALPAAPEALALYVTDLAGSAKTSTIARRISAIAQAHQLAGFSPPNRDARVRTVLAGIRRAKGVAQAPKSPLLVDDLKAMLAALPGNLLGCRDRALLLVGFAGALRRSELVALDWADIAFVEEGLVIAVQRSKTDQEGQGRKIGIPYGRAAAQCPVRALAVWRDRAGGGHGPVFVPIDRHGHAASHRLSGKAVARIVKRALPPDRYDATRYSSHSLRAGLATAAAMGGASERAIMNQTGHRSVTTMRRYIREGTLFRENAAARTGL